MFIFFDFSKIPNAMLLIEVKAVVFDDDDNDDA